MAIDRRQKNVLWNVLNEHGEAYDGKYDHAILAVLMDIRETLQEMSARLQPLRVLHCSDFLSIPRKLDALVKQTRKPKRRKKVAGAA